MERNANAWYELVKAAVEQFNERIQCDEIEQGDDYQSALHEVCDGITPHYYHEIFTVMAADGLDHNFEDSGMMPDTCDISRICQARIYEQLMIDVPDDCNVVWFEPEEGGEGNEETFFLFTEGHYCEDTYSTLDEAQEAAERRCTETGTHYYVEGSESDEKLYSTGE